MLAKVVSPFVNIHSSHIWWMIILVLCAFAQRLNLTRFGKWIFANWFDMNGGLNLLIHPSGAIGLLLGSQMLFVEVVGIRTKITKAPLKILRYRYNRGLSVACFHLQK